jgi:hypothetical protein
MEQKTRGLNSIAANYVPFNYYFSSYQELNLQQYIYIYIHQKLAEDIFLLNVSA